MNAPPVAAPARKSPVEVALKWIAAVTAVLTLIGGLFATTRMLADVRERKRFIAEAFEVAARQRTGGDYAAAWATLEGGTKSADEGGQLAKLFGQLSEERRFLRQAQEELAMAWLRNLQVPSGKRFSDVVDRLLPVLERGAAASAGIARADRVAHIGWGYFLKRRDGDTQLDPAAQYGIALAADADNPYAHAFWGHWMVWTGKPLPAAMAHFDAAAKNTATLAFVRRLTYAALRGRGDDAQAQLLRVVNEMERNGERLEPALRREAVDIYASIARSGKADPFAQVAPPADHVMVIEDLASDAELDDRRLNLLRAAQGIFNEAGGELTAALSSWRTVRANAEPNDAALRARADAAIKRLVARVNSGS